MVVEVLVDPLGSKNEIEDFPRCSFEVQCSGAEDSTEHLHGSASRPASPHIRLVQRQSVVHSVAWRISELITSPDGDAAL